ncbi:Oxysterols receptor LXR-alpha [Acipenser ruthenus]|uniref:Oxysterols receptor LXR-alpha n=1 Tax=Acipenser ruthenus TaxID=7906 RepID=A0A444UGV5_ACIRT|nr:Oxysterols receptor LXR-alpha [Acipenser ruthenus]
MSTLSVTGITDVGHGESKVFVSACELQLDSSTEDSSSGLLIEGRHDSSHLSRFNGTVLGPAQDHGTDLSSQDLSPSPLNCAGTMDPADRMKLEVAADILAANTGVLSEEQIRLKKMKRQEDETARTSTLLQNHFPGAEAPKLAPEQLEMIKNLVAVQKQCNKSSFIDRLKVTPWPQSQDPLNREVRQQRFAHFTELAIMSVQEIVDFAKQLPGFLELTREDQIALLKTSTIEIMLLETSRRYNPAIECITFLKDFSYNKEDFAKAGLQLEFINPIFEFSKGMNDLHLDEAEFALLIAINIFSADRPNVQDHDLVERFQQPYVDALHSYIRIKRPNDHLMFPRMLMKLVSLRTLSSVHSEQVFALRLQDKKLPPLLSEIWDVHE